MEQTWNLTSLPCILITMKGTFCISLVLLFVIAKNSYVMYEIYDREINMVKVFIIIEFFSSDFDTYSQQYLLIVMTLPKKQFKHCHSPSCLFTVVTISHDRVHDAQDDLPKFKNLPESFGGDGKLHEDPKVADTCEQCIIAQMTSSLYEIHLASCGGLTRRFICFHFLVVVIGATTFLKKSKMEQRL